jgi:outer membrane protein TolC
MSLYNVGASISLPLDLFFGRKDRIKAGQSQIEQAKFQVEETLEVRKMEITQVYAELVANLRMMKYVAESFTATLSNVKLGEMEYANNSITLQELSGRRRDLTLAATSYEEAKSKLFISVRHLELITGIKLIP